MVFVSPTKQMAEIALEMSNLDTSRPDAIPRKLTEVVNTYSVLAISLFGLSAICATLAIISSAQDSNKQAVLSGATAVAAFLFAAKASKNKQDYKALVVAVESVARATPDSPIHAQQRLMRGVVKSYTENLSG